MSLENETNIAASAGTAAADVDETTAAAADADDAVTDDADAAGVDAAGAGSEPSAGPEAPSVFDKLKRKFASMNGTDRAVFIIRVLVILASALTLTLYIIKKHSALKLSNTPLAIASLILMTIVLLAVVPSVVKMFEGRAPVLRATYGGRKRRFLLVCLAALGIHIVMTLIGMYIYTRAHPNFNGNLYELWRAAWMKGNTDAPHYLKIAEMGYVNEGDDKVLLVFFPMLPALIRSLSLIFRDGYLSAQIINTAAGCLTAGMLYLNFERIMDEKRAVFASLITLLLPGAIFMNSPMTEPLFMLFTACCFYYIQKEKLVIAGVFAALAGFTRSLGVLLAVPIGLQGICLTVRAYKEKNGGTKRLLTLAAALIVSTFGTLLYLHINKLVTGDPLRFMYYESSHWSQRFGLFVDTPRYLMDYFLGNIVKDFKLAYSLFLSQLIMILGTLIVYIAGMRKLPATYTAYFVVYFIASVGCTWLLSSVRYLSILLPLAAAIAMICRRRWQRITTAVVCTGVSIFYMTMYMQWLGIY